MKKVKKTAKTGSRPGRRPTAKKKAAAARAGSQARPARPRPSATPRVRAIPDGFHTATPALTVRGAAQALEFYKRAFGAKERMRMPGPGGGGLDLCGAASGGFPVVSGFVVRRFVHRCGSAVGAADDRGDGDGVAAGGGLVGSGVADPFGHEWGLATHKEDLSLKEVGQRANAFFAQMAAGGSGATPAAAGA